MATRRYQVGYALACGNTWTSRSFFRLSMAEKFADYLRAGLLRRYHTVAVFVTDLDNEERGDVYGTEED